MAAAFTATSKSRTRTLAIAVLLACIGPPAAAQQPPLLLPSAETYDGAGNLYFVDTNRNQVFEVSLAGALTTIAGTGVQGFSGDGAAATSAFAPSFPARSRLLPELASAASSATTAQPSQLR